MKNNLTRSPQLGAALVLSELLKEHPELAVAGWTIDSMTGSLFGFLQTELRADLEAYASVIGGEVVEGFSYVHAERTVTPFRLSTVWRDVPMSMTVTVPLALLVERAA